ncbi:sulfurtransferase [Aerococcus urinaehominis]|uniref:Sulfurtransferase n=1 Tax=Aerococcus urinaehominis TaxID=128944 RepID=A0A109RGT8_9LACT|nr:rhodanese-like domain-containing protein [Aerococcus urinaehominis]AMB98916.1 sulfurtransferase [Aerococcus urinaehominis]SDM39446.1 Rhodanese-related sulfurtransferase [Aerococcus urinaehominis]
MSVFSWITLILWIFIIAYGIYWLVSYFLRRNAANEISQEDFAASMRQAQVVDVREPQEFRSAHILGARNVPYSQIHQAGAPGFNKRQPIYLYDDGALLASRAARLLRKAGYDKSQLYILKGGMANWQGKVKRR